MAKKKLFLGMLVMALALGMVLTGCPTEAEETDAPTLDELLRTYMGPNEENWGDEGIASVYYLDPDRFAEFKTELEEGEEYVLYDDSSEDERDHDKGMAVARWVKKPDDKFQLEHWKKDNSKIEYMYVKVPSASGQLDELLRTYMGPREENWDDDEIVSVYYLDPDRFEKFKAELDAGGEYYQADDWTNDDREWNQGRTFARWVVRPDGSFQLDLEKSDNSETGYWYKKVPQVGDTWEEEGDEGKITLTYLGLENPGFDLDHEGEGWSEYKGYYTFYYQEAQNGHHKCYVYYPTSGGKSVQYSKWLD
jgi:hypothetical protein